jgi:hypothetical protein
MADEKLEVVAEFKDDYSKGAEKAADDTERLDNSLQGLEGSTVEANIAFQTQIQTLEAVSSGYNQVFGGVQDLGIVNEKQIEQMRKIKGGLDLTIGSMKLYTVWTELSNKLTEQQIALMGTAALAIGSVAIAMLAVNAATEEQRAYFSVLTGVTAGLAVSKFMLATAEMSYKSALTLGVGAGAIVAGITYMVSSMNAAKQEAVQVPGAQTDPGEVRRVTRGGFVELHTGDEVSRPAEITEPMPMRGFSGTIILQGVYDLDKRDGLSKVADALDPYLSRQQRRTGTLRPASGGY